MSLEIGQYRAPKPISLDSFITPIEIREGEIHRQASIGDRDDQGTIKVTSVTFTQQAIFLDTTTIKRNKKYYLKFQVETFLVDQIVDIRLTNRYNDTAGQLIESFLLPKGENDNSASIIIETTFMANNTYDMIVLEIKRDVYNFPIRNAKGTRGFVLEISRIQFAEIQNLLDLVGANALTQMKVRGPAGLLMCINGESIRINPGNVYEINNGYEVSFLGFIPNQQDYFILDYQYQS